MKQTQIHRHKLSLTNIRLSAFFFQPPCKEGSELRHCHQTRGCHTIINEGLGKSEIHLSQATSRRQIVAPYLLNIYWFNEIYFTIYWRGNLRIAKTRLVRPVQCKGEVEKEFRMSCMWLHPLRTSIDSMLYVNWTEWDMIFPLPCTLHSLLHGFEGLWCSCMCARKVEGKLFCLGRSTSAVLDLAPD